MLETYSVWFQRLNDLKDEKVRTLARHQLTSLLVYTCTRASTLIEYYVQKEHLVLLMMYSTYKYCTRIKRNTKRFVYCKRKVHQQINSTLHSATLSVKVIISSILNSDWSGHGDLLTATVIHKDGWIPKHLLILCWFTIRRRFFLEGVSSVIFFNN